ncbi:hypothetical protein [Humibacillus xanthopallidus]|uniref:hypothetical protein n=1 Tax=Humibacillus xanthopallidus TaxID=412689 RepID=UPI003851075A
MSQRVSALVAATEEATRELPMPVIAYFIIAFVSFIVLLGITWSFRNTAAKVGQPRRAPGAPGTGQPGSADHARDTDGTSH